MDYKRVQILPMDRTSDDWNGRCPKEVKYSFFLGVLKFGRDDSHYKYKSSGLNLDLDDDGNVKEQTLILFQYDNHIIASAEITKIDKDKKMFYFDSKSIMVFKSIGVDYVNKIFEKNIEKFSDAKHILCEGDDCKSKLKRFYSDMWKI